MLTYPHTQPHSHSHTHTLYSGRDPNEVEHAGRTVEGGPPRLFINPVFPAPQARDAREAVNQSFGTAATWNFITLASRISEAFSGDWDKHLCASPQLTHVLKLALCLKVGTNVANGERRCLMLFRVEPYTVLN